MKQKKSFYRRNLPHIQPVGAAFFVTFRLSGSLPYTELKKLKERYETKIRNIKAGKSLVKNRLLLDARKRYFSSYDNLLDTIQKGPMYLEKPEIAKIVTEQLHRFDGEFYDLICYCIMPNHVHILIDTQIQIPENVEVLLKMDYEFTPLDEIMKRIKGPSALYANRVMKRTGKFWQRESFDHYIRTEKEFDNVMHYILMNPVKAGLAERWEDWKFSYLCAK